jgi:hypothetical protein
MATIRHNRTDDLLICELCHKPIRCGEWKFPLFGFERTAAEWADDACATRAIETWITRKRAANTQMSFDFGYTFVA